MKDSADRLIAARLLVRIEAGAFSSRLLETVTAAGVRARVLGVGRWLRLLDAGLGAYCRRPLDRLDPEVRAVLRMGLFEAWQLGVPAPLAVDSSAHLVRRLGKSSAAGMVNAVLRRAVRDQLMRSDDIAPGLRLSHPEWLYRRWLERFGADRTLAMMVANQEPAATWVWFANSAGAGKFRSEDREMGIDLIAHPWCPGAFCAPGQARELIAAVRQGHAYVQDPASQLVAHIGAALSRAGCLADLCAAPGGKTALLRRLRDWSTVAAMDRRLLRLRPVANSGVRLLVHDAAKPTLQPRARELVLLDAPCSGTGTLGRHPELRWRLDESAIGALAATQARLLAGGCNLVRGGGVLLYTTCSVEPEENEDLLRVLPAGFTIRPLADVLPPGTPWIATPAGGIRLLPSSENDGFTIHALGLGGAGSC